MASRNAHMQCLSVFSFNLASSDVKRTIFRWMHFSTLVAVSCASKTLHMEVLEEAHLLFDDLTTAASTWQAFIDGAATIYKLGYFIGRRVEVPDKFVNDLYGKYSVIAGPTFTSQALELIYFVVTCKPRHGFCGQCPHKKQPKNGCPDTLRPPLARSGAFVFDRFMKGVISYAECRFYGFGGYVVLRKHVECALHLLKRYRVLR